MQKIRLDLHIRFNPQNERHRRAAAYMEPVKEKYRTALVVAAMEEYQRQHPYGADYRELDEIRKGSYRSCQPKHPIQENLKKQATEQPALTPAPGSRAEAPHPAANSLDQMIALYNLEDDE